MDLSEEETAPLVKTERTASHKSSCECAVLVRLYYNPTSKTESTLSIPAGHITAENVCVLAAKTSGVLPVFTSLFALASEDLSYWYSPTHVFKSEESVTVYYRVRFFFSGWFGQGSKAAYRYSLTPGRICAVLDYSVIDYLFAQSRSDFISGRGGLSPPRTAMQECLGMAVLDLWQRAKEMNCSPKDVCRTISYKTCLPEVHREDIEQMSRLARYRIRQMLKRFLRKLGCCPAGDRSLKLKYLMELSAMEPNYGTERFSVRRPGLHQHGDTQSMAVRVSGEGGIQTSSNDSQEWQTFCDFPQITDINMKRVSQGQQPVEGRVVTLTRQDDRCLEVEFKTQEEALSFVSLIDGYFRLTTDSTHYFCSEVAPPSLLQDMDNLCHGPVMSEFAVHKLKKVGGAQNGACLLRHSPKEFDKYFLMVCLQTPLGVDYRDCLIEKSEKFHLAGVHTSFCSLRELVQYYQHNILLLSDTPVTLGKCCPPRAKELSNLIIIRNSSITGIPSSSPQQRARPSHIQFHMIRHEDLVWGESLGQGSFTHIYRGSKTDKRDGETHTTDVLLKVLDAEHKNSWESFFEAASLMSQISHKHLLLVYGVSVHKSKNIMVQEYVKHGALDLYLKRSAVSLSWKLDVVKQLACMLNFLEEKNIVHGNICAKNLLLVREGEPNSETSPFIKLSDPGIGVALLGKEVVLDRIPWVAPEVLETLELGQQSDKWSFGTTLWEIFNRGEVPLHRLAPLQKQQFYEQCSQLPCLEWTELAELISQCMQYQPELRPSARAIIRHLNSLITSDYEILHASGTLPDRGSFWAGLSVPIQQHHDVFEERHLRFISPLGKGNFGSVELCRYDPLGDNTGELVAVKQLQPNKQANMADFQKEIQTISSLHCDYIVKYRGICYSAGRLSMRLVMEYLPYGTLIGYMEKNKHNISNRRLLLFASQICKGMEYLQSLRYVHRDLAARNILVASDTLVKIADFGLTKFIPFEKEYYKVTQCGESPIFWYAPESISEYIFSHKSDVWSFGIVLHELFSFCELSRNPKRLFLQQLGGDIRGTLIAAQLVNVLKDNWRLPSPPLCPPKVYSMMLQCWALNSEDRPTFSRLQDLIESSLLDEREGSKG